MFDRLILAEDLIDCRGAVLGRKGFVVSPQAIAEAAQRAPALPRHSLGETALAADAAVPLDASVYRYLFVRPGVREVVERALLAVQLPEILFEELIEVRRDRPALLRHAFATAAVTVRMLLAAVGEARAVPDLAAAALLHDIGMRQLPARLHSHPGRLPTEEAHRIAAHPLLGAYHLACVLGTHPAVSAAESHHWRCGQGYPALSAPPSRAIEAIGVASAFAALTQPRSYRSGAYDSRGAADVLVEEAIAGHADESSVKLLVHALRGGAGDPRAVRFGVIRDGHAPHVNNHGTVEAPPRSLV
jgi:hypothetical protein